MHYEKSGSVSAWDCPEKKDPKTTIRGVGLSAQVIVFGGNIARPYTSENIPGSVFLLRKTCRRPLWVVLKEGFGGVKISQSSTTPHWR